MFVAGILSVIAFLSGLVSGISCIRGRNYRFAIAGACMVMASGIIDLLVFRMWFWVYGGPKLVLSILGLILIAVSKNEFAPMPTNPREAQSDS